jgi:dipeptidyl aminopeptidase/acylaminoacyl peptidase
MRVARLTAFFVATCVIACTVIAALGFALSIRPHRFVSGATPAQLGWAYESISLRTEDGLNLSAWLIPAAAEEGRRRAVIVLHGYPFSKGDMIGVTGFLHADHDLLLLDMRYFGASEGSLTTLGHHEWRDVAAGVRYLKEREYGSIGVWGISLGASVGLVALEHEIEIDAIVADSPYSDLHEMTLDYYLRLPILAPIMATMTDVLARVVIGVAPSDVSPARAAAGSRTPMLLVHGTDDRTIPLQHHERVVAALGPHHNAQTLLIAGAGHGQTYPFDRAGYEARVLEFFGRYLS